MHDAAKIVGGLVLFAAVMTQPFWYNALTAAPAAVPALDPPPNGSKEFVEPRAYMRANHMDLLNESAGPRGARRAGSAMARRIRRFASFASCGPNRRSVARRFPIAAKF